MFLPRRASIGEQNVRLWESADALMQVAQRMAQQYQKQSKGLTKAGQIGMGAIKL